MQSSRRATAVVVTLLVMSCVVAKVMPQPDYTPKANAPALPTLPNTFVGMNALHPNIPEETTPTVRAWLPAKSDIAIRTYRDPENSQLVQVVRLTGTDRDDLHDPRSCLVGVGWRITGEKTVGAENAPVHVGRMERDGFKPFIVAYAYVLDGKRIVANPTQIRAMLLWQAMTDGVPKNIVFWRLMTPCPTGASGEETTRTRLCSLVEKIVVPE